MENYVKNFDINVSLSMDSFEKYENKLKEIESNSQLRKIYDSYVNIQDTNKPDDEKKLLVQILFAKTAYQESRKSQWKTLIPSWFAKFLNQMFDKINNIDRYKQFLEVFVAYHRYFNPEKK